METFYISVLFVWLLQRSKEKIRRFKFNVITIYLWISSHFSVFEVSILINHISVSGDEAWSADCNPGPGWARGLCLCNQELHPPLTSMPWILLMFYSPSFTRQLINYPTNGSWLVLTSILTGFQPSDWPKWLIGWSGGVCSHDPGSQWVRLTSEITLHLRVPGYC